MEDLRDQLFPHSARRDVAQESQAIEDLPLPPSTKPYKPSPSVIKAMPEYMDFATGIFISELTREEIIKFYRNYLTNRGWHEFDLLASFSKMIDFPDEIKAMAADTVTFVRKPYNLTIMFGECIACRPGDVVDDVVEYNIVIDRMPQFDQIHSYIEPQKPDQVGFMPLHPSLGQLSEDVISRNQIVITYASNEDPHYLANYYKIEMPKQGWVLQDEDGDSSLSFEDMPANLPDIDVYRLKFRNNSGDSCEMRFLKVTSGQLGLGMQTTGGHTMVTVTHKKSN